MEKQTRHQFIEKRATTRYPVSLFVEFENGRGWTHDASPVGVCIETDQPLSCGVAIRFILNQPDPQGWGARVQCGGLVVWAEKTRDGLRVGVRIEEIMFES